MKHLFTLIAIVAIFSTSVTVNAQGPTWLSVGVLAGCSNYQEIALGGTFSNAIDTYWVISGSATTLGCNIGCSGTPGAGTKAISSGFSTAAQPDVYLEYGFGTPFLTNFHVDFGTFASSFDGRVSVGGPNKVLIEAFMVKNGGYNLVYSLEHSINNPNCFTLNPQGSIIEVESEDTLVIRFHPFFDGNPVDPNAWFGLSHFGVSGDVGLGILPVGLIQFNAHASVSADNSGYGNNQVRLTWSTASELNNSHFVVDHSTDGYYWRQGVTTVNGVGNSTEVVNYVRDVGGEPGVNYYRLRQFDFDGTEEVLETVSVTLEETQSFQTLVARGEMVNIPKGLIIRNLQGVILGVSNGTFVFNQSGTYLVGRTKLVVQ